MESVSKFTSVCNTLYTTHVLFILLLFCIPWFVLHLVSEEQMSFFNRSITIKVLTLYKIQEDGRYIFNIDIVPEKKLAALKEKKEKEGFTTEKLSKSEWSLDVNKKGCLIKWELGGALQVDCHHKVNYACAHCYHRVKRSCVDWFSN